MCNVNGIFSGYGGHGMMNWGGGHSFMSPFGGIFGIITFVVIIAIIVAVVMYFSSNKKNFHQPVQSNSALDILDREYAAGNITTEQYRERKENLTK